jgi:hypothetical protein
MLFTAVGTVAKLGPKKMHHGKKSLGTAATDHRNNLNLNNNKKNP